MVPGSVIISTFQGVLAEFQGMQFSPQWPGSAEGFGAHNSHRRCDVHANIWSVMLTQEGF
jgi:hypothetical protein